MDVKSTETFNLSALERRTVWLGFAVEIPAGYEIQVRPRSGLASKFGIVPVFGTVDEGYRGEIGVTVVNLSEDDYTVSFGDKIAQLVLAPRIRADIEIVEKFDNPNTERGVGGFGSTGK